MLMLTFVSKFHLLNYVDFIKINPLYMNIEHVINNILYTYATFSVKHKYGLIL